MSWFLNENEQRENIIPLFVTPLPYKWIKKMLGRNEVFKTQLCLLNVNVLVMHVISVFCVHISI